MRITACALLLSIFFLSSAQIKDVRRVEAANLDTFLEELQMPGYKEFITSEDDFIPDVVNEIFRRWDNFSEKDLKEWRDFISYLDKEGYPIDSDKGSTRALVYLTSRYDRFMEQQHLTEPNYDLVFTENEPLLHTAVLESAPMGLYEVDDRPLINVFLLEYPSDDELIQAYAQDFSQWKKKDQWDWLEEIFSNEGNYDPAIEVSTLLIENEVLDPNFRSPNKKESLFDVALEAGNFDVAKGLIEKGYDLNFRFFDDKAETALHRVMEMKDYAHDEAFGDLIALMLEKGANPDLRDIKGFTPVHYAIKNRHEVGFNALMSEEAEFNDRIGSLKELNYLQYFDKNWRKNAEARQKLIDKTGLTIPGKKKKKKK